jgi:hypothetical protein
MRIFRWATDARRIHDQGEWYEGVLSSTAILFWQSARPPVSLWPSCCAKTAPWRCFLGRAAGLNPAAPIDDFLGIHERFWNGSEAVLRGLWLRLPDCTYWFSSGRFLLTDYLLLGLALFFFGMSVAKT